MHVNLFRFSVIFCTVLRFLIYSNVPSLMQPSKVPHKVLRNKNAINSTFICCLTYNLSRHLVFTPPCLYFPFIFTVKMSLPRRYFYDLLDSTRKGGGWIGICKSADPLKFIAESVDPLKKSTKSECAITDPSRISALLFLVIFSTAWHRHMRKRKWAFRGDVEIHDPNFQTTKIQNPGP